MESFNKNPYDICIITAANEYQVQGYSQQIKSRIDKNLLPKETVFFVYSDPDGKRIGSGGSTIYALYRLLDHLCKTGKYQDYDIKKLLKEKRILILHSGGDSKRLPSYSSIGKIFVPLPTKSFPDFASDYYEEAYTKGFVTIFDLLFANLMGLPALPDGQVVVASGDVLLSFNASEVSFCDTGITGLAYPGTVEVASGHGVYIPQQDSIRKKVRQVADFLQKPNYEQLKQNNGLDVSNRAFVDTGIMNFSIETVNLLAKSAGLSIKDGQIMVDKGSLCEDLINGNAYLDIYKEFPFAMLGKELSDTKSQNMESFVNQLNKIPFSVCLLSYCDFFHIGTSKQLLQGLHTLNYTASMYDFNNYSRSKVNYSELKEAFAYNSIIDTPSIKTNGMSIIEGCCLDGDVELSGDNIVTRIPKGAGNINLGKGTCLTCIPVINGWVSVIYGIEDDFKKRLEEPSTTFINEPFYAWMEEKGINQSDLWKDGDISDLWDAKLFPFDQDLSRCIRLSLALQSTYFSDDDLNAWKQSSRMSFQDILGSIDYQKLLDNYNSLCKKINLMSIQEILTPKSDVSTDEILSWCSENEDYIFLANTIMDMINQTDDILFQSRLYKILSDTVKEIGKYDNNQFKKSDYYEDISFNFVHKAIREGLQTHADKTEAKLSIRSDEVVWVCSPVRLDFGGGWSDTPPYCLERGGSVLNTAIKLNGQYPIQVIGKLHSDYTIKINSIDLGQHIVIKETDEILSCQDPSVWTSLPKAALVTTGIIPESSSLSLSDILAKFGSGIDLTLFSAVPSGSGLGTSSILGSAVIACLSRMFGRENTSEELFNRTLYMEQLMTTGGGWQDQIGGIIGGVKHIQTTPSLFPMPTISWSDLKSNHNMDLSERFLLYYTGYRRMAKNILKNIVGKYIDRDSLTLQTIQKLREKSFEMKTLLDHRNIDEFGKKIADVWKLNKILDPGSTNDDIENIIGKISHLTIGLKLLGAGGGGFLFIVTKGIEQTNKIKKILESEPPNDRARFFDFDIDQEGLKISVL